MIYNNFLCYPFLPPNCQKPPTLYSILNSIVNGDKENLDDYVNIKDLAKEGRNIIFNFDYPLTQYINREKFETMILNHFLMRRIEFETVTAFRIQLDVKLNEIMPIYNKLFDALENWNIFTDGETVEKSGTDNRNTNSTNNTTNETSNILNNKSTTSTTDTTDRRNSDTPQNQLQNVRDGKYVTNYSYDTNNTNGSDSSESSGKSNSTNNSTTNSTDNNIYTETTKRTQHDKIAIYKEMQENIKSIYTMIFQELEVLFYSLM